MELLLVDDNTDLLNLIDMYFTEIGHSVYQATNGLEALEVMASNPDKKFVLITDFDMPEMNGAELISTIHKNSIAVEMIILISGRIDDISMRRMFEPDWDIHYFSKPFCLMGIENLISQRFTISNCVGIDTAHTMTGDQT